MQYQTEAYSLTKMSHPTAEMSPDSMSAASAVLLYFKGRKARKKQEVYKYGNFRGSVS